jgi:hypothetical protein
MPKNIVCNVRLTEDMRHSFRMAALKNKTTVQDVLFEAVQRYISESGTGGGGGYSAEEEAADIAYIEAHRGEPSFPLSEVLRDYEAQHGSFPPGLRIMLNGLPKRRRSPRLKPSTGRSLTRRRLRPLRSAWLGRAKNSPALRGLWLTCMTETAAEERPHEEAEDLPRHISHKPPRRA